MYLKRELVYIFSEHPAGLFGLVPELVEGQKPEVEEILAAGARIFCFQRQDTSESLSTV